jgi:plasmid replication initiation protein
MTGNEYTPLEALSYRKSNELVSAKYKSTLLENQLLAIALTRIEAKANDNNAPLYARLYPNELKQLVGDPTHIYSRLKVVAKAMTGHTIVLEDQKGNFKAMSIVTNADYENGVLTIRLNNDLRNHILGLEKRYTTLELSIMTGFRRDSSFRLYEILKSNIYKAKNEKDGKVELEYNLSELRFMIGLCNADDVQVRAERNRMGNDIDWDVLYEKLDKKDKIYERWSELERNVLRPARDELAQKGDITFSYYGIRQGRKIKRVHFTVCPNEPKESGRIRARKEVLEQKRVSLPEKEAKTSLQNEKLHNYTEILHKYTGHNDLTEQDLLHLYTLSDHNADLVERAINACDHAGHITNYMGWLISFIKSGGYHQTEVLNGSHEESVMVHSVTQDARKQDVAKKVWARIKEKDDFPIFQAFLSDNGLTVDDLETVYSYDRRNKIYFSWKQKKDVPF